MSKVQESFDAAADYLRAGNKGRIGLGEIAAEEWEPNGITYEQAKEEMRHRGVELPTDSRLSVYKKVYQKWVVEAGLSTEPFMPYTSPDHTDENGDPLPMDLSGVAIDKLYRLADEVTDQNAIQLLAWAYTHTEQQHRARKQSVKEGESKEKREKRVEEAVAKTITVNPASHDQFLRIVDRLRSTQGDPNITKAQTFDFIVGQFDGDSLSDEALSFLWRQAHGEISEEELEAAEAIDIELS